MTKWNRIDHQKCINWNLLTHESSHKITLPSTDSMTQAKRVVTLPYTFRHVLLWKILYFLSLVSPWQESPVPSSHPTHTQESWLLIMALLMTRKFVLKTRKVNKLLRT